MADTHELRTLLAPISGSRILLPGSVVAEVVEFSELTPFKDAPDWMLGELEWNGWQIPVIHFAHLAGTSLEATVAPRSRILVVKTLTEAASVLYIGFVISGMPRLKTLTKVNLAETSEESVDGVFSHVSVEDQSAVIPDLDVLAATIEQAVYRNA